MTAKSKETILVIEDDPSIRTGLELNLRFEGYRVLLAGSCAEGAELARTEAPSLIILDLMLPDGSGLDVLRALRKEGLEMQVLILSALGQQEDLVRGLELGADDYLTKPFAVAELTARMDAALRRERQKKQQKESERLNFGDISIDRAARLVFRGDDPIKLTSREYQLLLLLAERPDRVLTRRQLLEAVWGPDYEGTSRTVDNFISALRAKIEIDPTHPRHLKTVHGVGYVFDRGG